jgi:hypothetical protein
LVSSEEIRQIPCSTTELLRSVAASFWSLSTPGKSATMYVQLGYFSTMPCPTHL